MQIQRIQQLCNESLALKGDYKGGWFQRLVAARYMLSPQMEPQAVRIFEELAKVFMRQEEFLSSWYEMHRTEKDPYKSMKHLTKEVNAQKDSGVKKPIIAVYDDDPSHPVFDRDTNTTMRWVHDIMGHFKGQHAFSARGEYAAYNQHCKTIPPKLWGALFTEIVGQTSCYCTNGGNYVPQKVVILEDFDFKNVGLLSPSSPLNDFFVLEKKELVLSPDYDASEFKSQHTRLFAELLTQKCATVQEQNMRLKGENVPY